MRTFYRGEIATTPTGELLVILEPEAAAGGSICQEITGDQLTGSPRIVETSTLTRVFVPIEQARAVFAQRENLPLQFVPEFPIGTREHAEYGWQIHTKLLAEKQAILAAADPKTKAYRAAESFIAKYGAREF